MIVYKIRHKTTGLFSKGGTTPRWSKTGKTWNRPCDLSNHFSCVEEVCSRFSNTGWPYEDAEIVISEITQTSETLSIGDWREQTRAGRERRRTNERARRAAAIEQHLTDARRKAYDDLKKEFG